MGRIESSSIWSLDQDLAIFWPLAFEMNQLILPILVRSVVDLILET